MEDNFAIFRVGYNNAKTGNVYNMRCATLKYESYKFDGNK